MYVQTNIQQRGGNAWLQYMTLNILSLLNRVSQNSRAQTRQAEQVFMFVLLIIDCFIFPFSYFL